MLRRISAVIAGWPFLIALCLLLANDWWLKSAHPGWLSGKLSDFAGLALAGLLAQALWPRRFAATSAAIALAWLWWKSPLSGPAIAAVNAWLPFALSRTVDYGDLLALAVLPLCRLAFERRERLALSAPAARRWLTPPLALAALLACVATSAPQLNQKYGIRSRAESADLDRAKAIEAFNAAAQAFQLQCLRCDPAASDGEYIGGEPRTQLYYHFVSSREVRFDVFWTAPGLFSGDKREQLQALRDRIRREMALRIPHLDYLEPIS
ncbi:hypothetical protein [Chromobacterium subtsugae]|uniref:hypothetical protein n=1 Tax=Chromobacterium subtsugae TaxID=251747 RepID=UPI000A745836|nr:hypothetical protein [Chromobacterium subtsugae]